MELLTIILSFAGAFLGSFFGLLLAKTERKIPVVTPVKEAVTGEAHGDTVDRKHIQAWLYGDKAGGGG